MKKDALCHLGAGESLTRAKQQVKWEKNGSWLERWVQFLASYCWVTASSNLSYLTVKLMS